ncbi:MAG: hypothetical protein JWN46_2620 [Acidimicrobiales bacterium]|nr:hypothetical protein [Acidimicrobiales bacterium]
MIDLLGDMLGSAIHWFGPFLIGSSVTAGALALSGRITNRLDPRATR